MLFAAKPNGAEAKDSVEGDAGELSVARHKGCRGVDDRLQLCSWLLEVQGFGLCQRDPLLLRDLVQWDRFVDRAFDQLAAGHSEQCHG